MKKNSLLVIVLSLISPIVFSQNIESSVLSSQGGYDKTGLISLEWTLGENSIETVTHKNNIFSQGFNQSFISKKVKIVKREMFEYPLDIIVYPNPVTASFTVYLSATFDSVLNADLYDITGRMVKHSVINKMENTLVYEVGGMPSGIYLLRVSNASGLLLKAQKIIKK
jgi:hypothetical protein